MFPPSLPPLEAPAPAEPLADLPEELLLVLLLLDDDGGALLAACAR